MYSLIIIDDEEKIASGIGALFPWEDIGFHVSGTFTRACDALEFIKENQVDVVLTDVEMPDINGIDLAQRFKGDEKVQVVLFSSYDTYEYLRAAIKNEVVDFLLKPIKYSQLLECFDGVREKLRHKGVPGMSGGEHREDRVTGKIKEYLDIHYQHATLEDAAERVNMIPSYLSRFFKEKSGIGFRELLLKTRMEKASELLGDQGCKMCDVAYLIGYDNPKNFSRAFKAYYGMTPVEYRKKRLEEI